MAGYQVCVLCKNLYSLMLMLLTRFYLFLATGVIIFGVKS